MACAEEVKASKDGKNPHFRSTYSTLEEVIAACRKGKPAWPDVYTANRHG